VTECTAPRHAAAPERAAPHAFLCRPCTSGLRRDLRRLPLLHAGLAELLDPRRASGPGTGSGGGLPYHEPAAEAMSQIAHDAAYWTMTVLAERQPPACPVRQLPVMCGWLAGQVEWVMYRPWAGDMAGAVASDAGRAIAVLDPMPRAEIPIPAGVNWCPACDCAGGLSAVVSQDAADRRPSMVNCAACGREWDATMWARLGRDIIRHQRVPEMTP
jgi:hypothetical protein